MDFSNPFILSIIGNVLAALGVIFAGIQIRDARRNQRQTKTELKQAQTEVERTAKLYGQSDEYIENVHLVTVKINDIIKEEKTTKERVSIINFGLDLETVMPWFKNTVTYLDHGNTPISYKGLIVNPFSPALKDLIDGESNIQTSTVTASIQAAKNLTNTPYEQLSFEIRSYNDIPHFHGFVINEEHLFFSFTEVKNNKLQGGGYPYLYIKRNKTSKLNQHLFRMFNTWFNYYWQKASSEVKIDKYD